MLRRRERELEVDGHLIRCGPLGHIVEGPTVALRLIEMDDVLPVAELIDDDVRYWQGFPDDEAWLVARTRAEAVGNARHTTNGCFAIVDLAAARIVGTWQAWIDLRTGAWATGLWLGAAGRGRGLGAAATRAGLALVQGHLGGRTIVAATAADNRAARALHARAGYVETGHGDHVLPDGRRIDAVRLRRVAPARGRYHAITGAVRHE